MRVALLRRAAAFEVGALVGSGVGACSALAEGAAVASGVAAVSGVGVAVFVAAGVVSAAVALVAGAFVAAVAAALVTTGGAADGSELAAESVALPPPSARIPTMARSTSAAAITASTIPPLPLFCG
jgi:hypothetical protein